MAFRSLNSGKLGKLYKLRYTYSLTFYTPLGKMRQENQFILFTLLPAQRSRCYPAIREQLYSKRKSPKVVSDYQNTLPHQINPQHAYVGIYDRNRVAFTN